MEGILLASILSSVGLGISSFFGFFLLKNKRLENRLLAWLLIALSIRITKSIFYTHIELPLIIKNLGLSANLAVGPLLYLYVRVLLGDKKIGIADTPHFIPAVCYFILSPVLPNGAGSDFWMVSYSFILLQSFIYVFLSAQCLIKKSKKRIIENLKWVAALLSGLALMWLVYLMIFLKILPLYTLGPVTYSILIFALLYVALNHYQLFTGSDLAKYSKSRITDDLGKTYFLELQRLLNKEELYKRSDLSLSDLAREMDLLARDVSLIINKYGACNFARFVNEYRIGEAKRLMIEDPGRKVISVAYESGFKNLGTFNQVFKSLTGVTPSEFRKFDN